MAIISSQSTLWHPKPHSSSFSSTWERFKAPFENQNSHHERPIFNSAQLNQLWAAENEANMSPLQKWTCLSVFELLLRFLSSEHSKHILKNLWLRIFHSLHEFFEKMIFVPQYSHRWAFCKQILNKIGFGASKKLKKMNFFRFFKNDRGLDIWSL